MQKCVCKNHTLSTVSWYRSLEGFPAPLRQPMEVM